MSYANRATLRNHFGAGSRPTADHFSQLIGSTLNIADDGIYKDEVTGLHLRTIGDHPGLVSFLRADNAGPADWSIGLGPQEGQLAFRPGPALAVADPPPLLTLQGGTAPPDGSAGGPPRVGINTARPRAETSLDVAGAVGMSGRLGEPWRIKADGERHPITRNLHGCQALEIVAGVGAPDADEGRFALLHAIAMNAYSPGRWDDWFRRKSRIRQQHAWYGRRCDRLELRWESSGEDPRNPTYWLSLRTRCDYRADLRRERRRAGKAVEAKEELYVQVYVTKLWFDAEMAGSLPPDQTVTPAA